MRLKCTLKSLRRTRAWPERFAVNIFPTCIYKNTPCHGVAIWASRETLFGVATQEYLRTLNDCFTGVIGILAAYGFNLMLLKFSEGHLHAFGSQGVLYCTMLQEVWRSMFGAEMIPAGLFFLLLFMVTESPRFLIEKGHQTRGFRILERISGSVTAKQELAEITKALNREEGSIREPFRPGYASR